MSKRLKVFTPADAVALRRLFSLKKAFYDTSLMKSMDAEDFHKDNVAGGIEFNNEEVFTEDEKKSAVGFCYNINCFGRLGGFEIMSKIIKEAKFKAKDTKFEKNIFKTIPSMKGFMKKEHWEKYCVPIGEAGLEFLSKIDDTELKQVIYKDLNKLFLYLDNFFRVPIEQKRKEGISPLEEVELKKGLKLCQLPSLERKLTGIQVLMKKLGRLSNKWPDKEGNIEALSFASWLQANKFTDIIFGENIREEILKTSGELLLFMYVWGVLPEGKLLEMWEYAIANAQGIMLQLIEYLAVHFKRKDAAALFGKIKELPLLSLKDNVLEVLYALAKNEMHRKKKEQKKMERQLKKELEASKTDAKDELEAKMEARKEQISALKLEPDAKMITRRRLDKKEEIKISSDIKKPSLPIRSRGEEDLQKGVNITFHNEDREAALKRIENAINNPPKRSHIRTGSDGDIKTVSRPLPERPEIQPFIPEDDPNDPVIEPCNIIQFIWTLINNEALEKGLSLAAQNQIIELMMSLLSKVDKDECMKYAHLTQEMLARDDSFMQSSKIFMKVALNHGKDGKFIVINDLLQKFVVNIVKFKKMAVQKAIELSKENEEGDIFADLTTNDNLRITYYQELEQRLKVTEFLIIQAQVPLKAEIVSLLWQTLLLNNFSMKETTMFFEFMKKILESEIGPTLVGSHVFDSFFYEVLLKLDPLDYPLYAFTCLKEIIIALNICYNHMRTTPTKVLEVTNIDLLGFDMIWEILLQVRDSQVKKAAVDFLNSIYKRLSSELSERKGSNIRQDFLERCINNIQSGYEDLSTKECKTQEESISRVSRSIELLSNYITEFESIMTIKRHKQIPNEEYEITITDGGNKSKVKVNSTMKVEVLLVKIQKRFNYTQSLESLLFLNQGRPVKPSTKTLYEIGLKKDMTIMVTTLNSDEPEAIPLPDKPKEVSHAELEAAAESLMLIFSYYTKEVIMQALKKANGDTDQAASYLVDENAVKEFVEEAKAMEDAELIKAVNEKAEKLSEMIANNDKYFNILYNLLDKVNPELSEKAWVLIKSLPINKKIFNDLMGIASMEVIILWEEIYALDTPYKFLYNLSIITHILKTTAEELRYDWITSFVMLGGLNELCNSIKQAEQYKKLNAGSKILDECIAQSFKLVNVFLEGSLIGLGNDPYQFYMSKQENQRDSVDVGFEKAPEKKSEAKKIMFEEEKKEVEEKESKPEERKENSENKTESQTDKKEEEKKTTSTSQGVGTEAKVEDKPTKLVLRTEVAQMATAIIEHQNILKQVVNILRLLNVDGSNEAINEGFKLFTLIVLSDFKKAFTLLYSDEEYKDYLKETLIEIANENIKALLLERLSKLFDIYNRFAKKEWEMLPPDVVHLDMLFKMLPEPDKNLPNTETYFVFIANLFDIYTGYNAKLITTDIEKMIELLVSNIKRKLEEEITEVQEDKQLFGYMKLLAKLIEIHEDAFAVFAKKVDFDIVNLIGREVFGCEKKKWRKCANKLVMRSAVGLLLALCKKSPSYSDQLLPMLIKFHEAQLKSKLKEVGIEVTHRAPGNYVGLRNFGCTCYINSLMQQLYMIPEIRYNILELDSKEIAKLGTDHVAFNLQKIFANLQLSKQQYYMPRDFCKEFKDREDRPINVCIQEDVDEFFNRLTEKLETELKFLGLDRILKNSLEIELLQEIESLEKDLPYVSQREELSLALPLDVKGCKSLEDCLDSFVKEDILEGDNRYYCESYNKSIRASKKYLLKKLPQTLILILKRFEFNYLTMQKQKVNSYCEFPFDLNLYKWTYEGKKNPNSDVKTDYDYNLVGVLVHLGTAESGHYYSYIKERESSSKNYNKWFEFNDTRVTPFDPKNLKKEAYGTSSESRESIFGGGANAYFLIYQKAGAKITEYKGLNDKFTEMIEQETEALTDAGIYLDKSYTSFVKDYFSTFALEVVDKFGPVDSDTYEIKKKRLETQSILIQTQLDTSTIADEDDVMWTSSNSCFTMYKLAVLYANDLMLKLKETNTFKEWYTMLMPHIKQNSYFALWLIKYMTKHKKLLFDFLIEGSSLEVRDTFRTTLSEAIKVVAKVEEPYMREMEVFLIQTTIPDSKREQTIPRAASIRFVNLLLVEGLGYARANYRKFDEYFTLLNDFAVLGNIETGSLYSQGAVYLIIDFVANTPTPLKVSSSTLPRPVMGEGLAEANFLSPVKFLGTLIRSGSTERMRILESYPEGKKSLELPEQEVEYFFSAKWNYLSLICNAKQEITNILIHLTWENESRLKEVIAILTKYLLEKRALIVYKQALYVLNNVITVHDAYLKQRYLAFMATSVLSFNNIYDFLENCKEIKDGFMLDMLMFISELMKVEAIKEMIMDDKEKLKWAVQWISNYLKKEGVINTEEVVKRAKLVLKAFDEVLDLKPIIEKVESPNDNEKDIKENQEAKVDEEKDLKDKDPISEPSKDQSDGQITNHTDKLIDEKT